jgi:hypothetical protein
MQDLMRSRQGRDIGTAGEVPAASPEKCLRHRHIRHARAV